MKYVLKLQFQQVILCGAVRSTCRRSRCYLVPLLLKMFMAQIVTVAYSSLQILEQRNVERRCECCCRNTITLNQKWILKSELANTITNSETKAKSDWVDNMFSSLQKETSLQKATVCPNIQLEVAFGHALTDLIKVKARRNKFSMAGLFVTKKEIKTFG